MGATAALTTSARDGATRLDPLVDMIKRAASGHESAFAEFYSATGARVYGLVNRVLRNSALSAEVTQDVFVELWTQADRYDQRMGSVMGWVLTIAHRRAVDRVRHEERSRCRDTRYFRDNPQMTTDDVSDHVERRLAADHVRHALGYLTDRQRQAVQLAYFDGYSNLEVASLLGVPVPTVKTRIRDGLIRLRFVLGEASSSHSDPDDGSRSLHRHSFSVMMRPRAADSTCC